jgi:predicted metal-binding membrane protein
VLALPFTLLLFAWVVILIGDSTHQLQLLDHDFLLRSSHFPWLLALVLFLLAWQLMNLAMMLPSTLPLVSALSNGSTRYKTCWTIQSRFIVAYSLVWTLFALVAFVGDTAIHTLVRTWGWLALHSWLIGTLILCMAGLFQFTPIKRQALQHCFATFHLKTVVSRHSFHVGLQYGWFCVGSCWALMLALFALGMKSPLIMALASGLILVEKGLPGGQRFSMFIGLLCLLLAAMWWVGGQGSF